METAKKNLFRNSLDGPSWQEIRYFATIPCPVPCSKYAFFFPIQYNWPIFPVSASIMVAAGNVYTLLRVHDGMPEQKPPESIENQLI
jgi:hypothetical protein